MEVKHIKNSILVETRRLKESVRRNIRRFPIDFMFELTQEEWNNLRSQIATSSWGGQRYAPFAFTEQGIAMLSGLLNSDIAIEINISIMRAFVMMRQWAITLIADFDTHASAYYSACFNSWWTECPEGVYRRPTIKN
jgi:hypothetical protein